MRLHFQLLVGVLFTLANRCQALTVDDSKVGVFHFDGSSDGYAVLERSSSSYQNESESSMIEQWDRGYSYSYNRCSSRVISFGTWIKAGNTSFGPSTIMQFNLGDHYSLTIKEDQLRLLVATGSNNTKLFHFPDFHVSLNQWQLILLRLSCSREMPPSLYVKGLDKTPLKHLETEILGQGDLEDSTFMKIRTLIIGKGFIGRMTPPLIARHSSSTYFDRYITCLTDKDQSSSQCSALPYGKLPRSALVSSYDLSPNSNIKLEPYSEINVSFNAELQCQDLEVSLSILPAAFNLPTPTTKTIRFYDREYYYYRTRTYIDHPVNVTLGRLESGCNLTWVPSEGYRITNTNLTSCGFKSKNNGQQIVYQNSVYSHTHTESKKLMDVACRYVPKPVMRDEIRVSAYVVDEVSLETTHSFTPWSLSLHLFSDVSFSEELDVPVKLGSAGEMIYVEARLEASVAEVEVEVESCRTHITLNELDEMQRTLIKNSKVVSSSVQMLEFDSSLRKRFMFKADKFDEYPQAMVYLSCVLTARSLETAAESATEQTFTEDKYTKSPDRETTVPKATDKKKTEPQTKTTFQQKFDDKGTAYTVSDETEVTVPKKSSKEQSNESTTSYFSSSTSF